MNRKYIIEIETEAEDVEAEILDKFKFDFKFRIIDIKNVKSTRSTAQNSALHLWFTQLSEELNSKGFSVKMILEAGAEVEWTPVLIKEIMWRKLQVVMFGKRSTTQLFKSKEIDDIFDTINRVIIERTKGQIEVPPFPDQECLRNN